MTASYDLLASGVVLVVRWIAWVVLAATGGGLIGGGLAAWLGVPDATLSLVGRGVGVVLCLWIVGSDLVDAFTSFAGEAFGLLPGVGRAS